MEQYVEEVVMAVSYNVKASLLKLQSFGADVECLQSDTANNRDMLDGLDMCVAMVLNNWPNLQALYAWMVTGDVAGAAPGAALEMRLSVLEASLWGKTTSNSWYLGRRRPLNHQDYQGHDAGYEGLSVCIGDQGCFVRNWWHRELLPTFLSVVRLISPSLL